MRSLTELPWDSGWAVGSETARRLSTLLNREKPKRILDIGSGLTTVLFAEWAKDNKARVISLEHDTRYFMQTCKLLHNYGLDVDIRLCELRRTKHGMFYDTTLPINIDFVLIDGPPGSIGRQATLYSIYPYLSKNYTVWLDDAFRKDESNMLTQWQLDLDIEVIRDENFARGVIIK